MKEETKKRIIKFILMYLWLILTTILLVFWNINSELLKFFIKFILFSLLFIFFAWWFRMTLSLIYAYFYKLKYPQVIKRSEEDPRVWGWVKYIDFLFLTNPEVIISILKWLNKNK